MISQALLISMGSQHLTGQKQRSNVLGWMCSGGMEGVKGEEEEENVAGI